MVQQEKIAFFIALLDGECEITETHWEAAGVMMEIDRLVDRAAVVMVERHAKREAG